MPSSRSIRRRRATISRFLLFVLAVSLFLISTQPRWQSQTISTDLKNATSVLWVIAHRMSCFCVSLWISFAHESRFFRFPPSSSLASTADDESFFFAPSILNLINEERGVQGSLLCLSIGKFSPFSKFSLFLRH